MSTLASIHSAGFLDKSAQSIRKNPVQAFRSNFSLIRAHNNGYYVPSLLGCALRHLYHDVVQVLIQSWFLSLFLLLLKIPYTMTSSSPDVAKDWFT